MSRILVFLFFVLSCCTPTLHSFISEECGGVVGDVACDFELIDRNEDLHTLWEHHQKVIILDFSALWCGPCQEAAFYSENILSAYPEDEIVWITVLTSNMQGEVPNPEDLDVWVTHFGLEEPLSLVLSGDRSLLRGYILSGYPTFFFINKDMQITEIIGGWSALLTIGAIDESFASTESPES